MAEIHQTVFVCAMACELEAVCRAFGSCAERPALQGRRLVSGTLGGKPVAAILCGIGKVNAATAVQLAVDRLGAVRVVSAGVAGGLRTTMNVGDVYAVRAAVQYDFDLSQIDHVPVGQLEEFSSREFPFTVPAGFPSDLLATGDHFRDGDEDYPLLLDDIDAGLRDMEGAAVAHAAIRAGCEVMGLKAVSNVRGKGSMHGQYAVCRDHALSALTRAVSTLSI